jgi:hypothetical protein
MAQIREVSLTMEDCAAMTAGVEYGCSLLGLAPGFNPAEAQPLLEDFLERFRIGLVEGAVDQHAAAKLGLFWGMTIVLAYDWNWVSVAKGDWRGFGVADAQRRHLALPIPFFQQLMHDETGWEMPGPAARFRAIGATHLPASKPGEFRIITS